MNYEVEPKEKIKVYDLSGRFLGMQDRSEFYKQIREEYKKTGKITRQVQTVRLFLMNDRGGIYLAKRSRIKKENKLLYDKTIGAHVVGNETPEFTVLRECTEELGFPAAVLTDREFDTALSETDLRIVGIIKKVETINAFKAKYRYEDGSFVVFPQITSIFVGVFHGPVKFKDGETSGIEVYYTDEILGEIERRPERYTEDLKILTPKYLNLMKGIIKKAGHRMENPPS